MAMPKEYLLSAWLPDHVRLGNAAPLSGVHIPPI